MNLRALFGRRAAVPEPPPTTPGFGRAIVDRLRAVIDPELGVNVVDLGLVYGLAVEGDVARVALTMTTPACPMSRLLTDAVRRALRGIPSLTRVEVDVVWAPAWTPDMAAGTAGLLFPYRR